MDWKPPEGAILVEDAPPPVQWTPPKDAILVGEPQTPAAPSVSGLVAQAAALPQDAGLTAQMQGLRQQTSVQHSPEWWAQKRYESAITNDPMARAPALIREPYYGVAQAGAGILSTVARPVSKGAADYLAQTGQDISSEAESARQKDWAPWLSRMYGGAVQSLTQMAVASPLGGAGVIGSFAATEGNQALYDAEQAGLKGWERTKYAVVQGAVEGALDAALLKFAPGASLKKFIPEIAKGVMQTSGSQFLKMTLGEGATELLTEVGHAVAESVYKVNPQALDSDQFWPRMRDTLAQTLLTVGLAHGAARISQNKRDLQQLEQVQQKGFVSEKDGKDLGLSEDEMKNRKTREEAVQKKAEGLKRDTAELEKHVPKEGDVVESPGGRHEFRSGQWVPVPQPPQEPSNATEVRTNPGLAGTPGQVVQGSEANSGGNVQQTAQAGPAAGNGQEVRVAPPSVPQSQADATAEYPPGTKVRIAGYDNEFEVSQGDKWFPDGTLIDTTTNRPMSADGKGAEKLREYQGKVTVLSKPAEPTVPQNVPNSSPAAEAPAPQPEPKSTGITQTQLPPQRAAREADRLRGLNDADLQKQLETYQRIPGKFQQHLVEIANAEIASRKPPTTPVEAAPRTNSWFTPEPVPATDPPIPNGMTRLYHGSGTPGRYTGDAWYSTSREYARNYRGTDAELQYVDVPTKWAMEQLDPDGYGTPASTLEIKNDQFGPRKPLTTAQPPTPPQTASEPQPAPEVASAVPTPQAASQKPAKRSPRKAEAAETATEAKPAKQGKKPKAAAEPETLLHAVQQLGGLSGHKLSNGERINIHEDLKQFGLLGAMQGRRPGKRGTKGVHDLEEMARELESGGYWKAPEGANKGDALLAALKSGAKTFHGIEKEIEREYARHEEELRNAESQGVAREDIEKTLRSAEEDFASEAGATEGEAAEVIGEVDDSFDFGANAKPSVAGEQQELFQSEQQGKLFNVRAPPKKSQRSSAAPSELEQIEDELKAGKKESLPGQGTLTAPSGTASKPANRPNIVPQPGSASGAMLQPVQTPELFQIAKELMAGTEPHVKKLHSAAGQFKGQEGIGPLSILIDPKTAADEQALGQTLAHEIGHLIDFLPDNTLKRGNLLGRLTTLRSFMKHSLPPLEKNSVYRQELIDLTKWWSGDYTGGKKSYVQYRQSSRELYAEALSVFLNSPGDLESRAPQFYKALLDNLNTKPDVLAAYSTLQQMLNGTGQELAESRTQTLRDMFDRAEEHINSLRMAQEQQRTSVWAGITDFLGQYFLTSAQPVLTRLGRKPITKAEAPDAAAARFALDELFTIDSPNHTFLRNLDKQVYQPLIEIMQQQGLDRKAAEAEANFTLGEYLYHWRVANERESVANPAGFTATPSKAQLDAIKDRIGDKAYAKLEQHAQAFHDLAYAAAKEAAKEGVYNQKTFDEVITPNKDNYAAFRVTHYIDSPDIISTGVIQQVGTFSDIQNPFHATVLKVIRLNRLVELNRAKNRTRVFLEKNFPGDIKPVETVFTGEGRPRIPKKRPGHKKEHLVELVDGHPTYFEVPAEIAKSFTIHDIGGLGRIAALINSAAYKLFHPFYVTYNPGFVLANPFRDLRRTWVNLGSTDGITLGKLLSEWVKAVPVAHRRAKGIEDAVVQEMIDSHALDIPYVNIAAEDIDSQIDAMFQKYGLREKQPYLAERIPVIGKVLQLIEHAGAVTETATKVAAWRVLEEKGVPIQERSYRVRKYVGTPDFKQRGLATGLSNSALMYSRVRWNGLQADVNLATHPDTAAGWWWRQTVNVILPTSIAKAAAYGALGWALRAMFGVDDDDESALGKVASWADETGRRIAKYFLTDYDVLPIGVNADGKAMFITIPRDDLGKFIARTWWHLTDLAQLPTGHKLREGEGARDVAGHLFTDFKEQLLPSASPPIELTNKWLQYASGVNPIDSFYNQQIVPEKEWTTGGWQSDSKMIAWTLDKFGSPGAVIHYAASPLLGESFEQGTSGGMEAVMKTAGAMSGLTRFLRVSDSGLTNEQWALLENADQEAAAFRASLPKAAQDASTRRYFLMRRESLGDKLSAEERKELRALNGFYNSKYVPLRKRLMKNPDDEAARNAMQAAAEKALGD